MTRWIPYAFVRIVFFFIAGIAAALRWPNSIPVAWQYSIVWASVTLYILVFTWNSFRKHQIINPGAIGLLAIAAMGYSSVTLRAETTNPRHISHVQHPITHYEAVVVHEPETRAWGCRIVVEVKNVRTNAGWRQTTGQVMLRLAEAKGKPFRYGDVLIVRGQPQPVPGPANPGEFDYRRYLASHHIVRQQSVTASDIRHAGHAPPSRVISTALHIRRWAEGVIRRHVPGTQQQALAIALVLGVTEGLDPQLMQAYAATGTLHVLAVSGLHISILYLVITVLLRPLRRLPPAHSRWVTVVLSLVILWTYAFVTGLSPSVLRAVIMFTLLEMARLRRQPPNTCNILAASAFLLLVYDPYNVVSVGFQLSYLAVLGIVALYPGIATLVKPKHWIIKKGWEMTAMSLAAQLATFPLSLLYFHQFPNYFLAANMVAIPGSFIILVAGLVLLATSFIPIVASVTGAILSWTIQGMNSVIACIEQLPHSTITNVYISPLQCALLVAVIVTTALWIYEKKRRYSAMLTLCVLAFTALQWKHHHTVANIRRLVIYNVPGQTALDIIDRGVVYAIADSALRASPQRVNFHITPYRIALNATTIQPHIPFQCSFPDIQVMVRPGLSIVQIHGRKALMPAKIKTDILIISHNAVYDLLRVLQHIDAAYIVLDSSNSPRYTQYILQVASKLKKHIHAVRLAGTFEYAYV